MTDILYKDESFKIIGACMEVHNELGCGFLESVYQEALEIVFKDLNIPYQREKELTISFRNQKLAKTFQADFICFNKIIVELKAVSELTEICEAQVFNYLKASNLRLGLLINFGEKSLKYKRIIM
ncbi:MAG TPA: GxxExxY protein [Lentisphaeria bacterium]|nr:MAG: NADH:ubiquinone oxidoreductase [Lentisphaerae bacterium GWF2_38_69]HBM15413.1 GxxExxY protein [Lentisphaeria bacterium]